jgi:hypothetical protein
MPFAQRTLRSRKLPFLALLVRNLGHLFGLQRLYATMDGRFPRWLPGVCGTSLSLAAWIGVLLEMALDLAACRCLQPHSGPV